MRDEVTDPVVGFGPAAVLLAGARRVVLLVGARRVVLLVGARRVVLLPRVEEDPAAPALVVVKGIWLVVTAGVCTTNA